MTLSRFLCVVAVLVIGSSGQALARPTPVSITALSGKVLVSNGKGYQAARIGMVLSPGQSVVAGDDGEAALAQGECSILLSSTAVFTIRETPPCAPGEVYYVQDGLFVQPAGSTSDTASLQGGTTNTATETRPFAPAILPTVLGNVMAGTGTFSAAMIAAATETFIFDDPVTPE